MSNLLERVWTVSEASAELDIKSVTIKKWVESNLFQPHEKRKSGGTWLLDRDATIRIAALKNRGVTKVDERQWFFYLGKLYAIMYQNSNEPEAVLEKVYKLIAELEREAADEKSAYHTTMILVSDLPDKVRSLMKDEIDYLVWGRPAHTLHRQEIFNGFVYELNSKKEESIDMWEQKELYAFEEWCADFDVVPSGSNLDVYKVMWDVHEEAYIQHCLDHGYERERMPF